ncbi:MAG: PD-(D/E)XK nuclease-like domain-containing protein [Pseudomonadota bacterium]|nr:PD-(D/E)XK nuclease-like domain-containing protein [Pseudomonadota bacterium]
MNAQLKPSPATGIFNDVSPADYYVRRLDEASASGLKQMLRSPAHYRHWCENPDQDRTSPALAFGSLLHCAVLEPDVFARKYIVEPADAPSYPPPRSWAAAKSTADVERAKDFWRQWEAGHEGMTRVSTTDYDKVRRMADSAMSHPVARGLLIGGEREVTFRWQDEETGIDCKARADLYASGEFLMDLKSCRDASAEGFARAVAAYNYDMQAMHYCNGIQACGDSIKWFVFLAVESEAPYVCQPYILDTRAEERGWNLRQSAIRRLSQSLKSGQWPGYSQDLGQLSLPAYAFYNEDAK